MLRLAAILNFILAIGHIACMPWLDVMFRLYGIDGVMNDIASYGSALPYLITIVIAICFALCGIYALSADGSIQRLPLLWTGISVIAFVFLFRACLGCLGMIESGQYYATDISSAVVSCVIGLLYLIGGIARFKAARH